MCLEVGVCSSDLVGDDGLFERREEDEGQLGEEVEV